MPSRSYETTVVLALCGAVLVVPLVALVGVTGDPADTAIASLVGAALLLYMPATWVARGLVSRAQTRVAVPARAQRPTIVRRAT